MFWLKPPSIKFWGAPSLPVGVGVAQLPPMFVTPVENPELRANIRSWRTKNAPKLPLKYLKDWIWKIKQYLNYILMIINQNILAILRTFLNLKKKLWKTTHQANFHTFVRKIPNRKKISNEHFNLCEADISLDEIIKSINSETDKPPGNDGLTAEFYRHFSNELAPALLGVYDSWGKFDSMGVTSRGMISAIRTLSRTNYFWKTGRPPKREAPKKGHAKLLENW